MAGMEKNKNRSEYVLSIISRYVILVFCMVLILLTGARVASAEDVWTPKDELQRDKGPSSAECQYFQENPTALFDIYEKNLVFKGDIKTQENFADEQRPEALLKKEANLTGSDPAKCYLQKHAGNFENSDYTLAFLEHFENGNLRLEKQLTDLKNHLSPEKKHIVIAYVHGWRHDAHIGNADVQRFNMMLGYTRRNMTYRCRQHGRYCDHKLTGIFIGWPARANADDKQLWPWWCKWGGGWLANCNASLVASLKGIKETSENISSKVFSQLKSIEQQISAGQSVDIPPWEKSLLVSVGHSLGGNLLAKAVKGDNLPGIADPRGFVKKIEDHKVGAKMKNVLGDLVILLNPASEVENWIEIQRAVHKKNGIEKPQNMSTTLGSPDQRVRARNLFPLDQPPVYVSLSAACEEPLWAVGQDSESYFGKKKGCDENVSSQFPLHQLLLEKGFQERQRKAIGHYNPDGYCRKSKPKTFWQKIRQFFKDDICPAKSELPSEPSFYGTTHEIAMICGEDLKSECETPTNFYNAMQAFKADLNSREDDAICAMQDGWLFKARKRALDINKTWVKWSSMVDVKNPTTSCTNADGKSVCDRLHPTRESYAQFNHSIYRQKGDFYITSGYDPFWNVRATGSAVSKHNGVQGAKLWCAINQMFLDNIAAKPAEEPN